MLPFGLNGPMSNGHYYTLAACHDPEVAPPAWIALFVWYDRPDVRGAEPQRTLQRFATAAEARAWCEARGIELWKDGTAYNEGK